MRAALDHGPVARSTIARIAGLSAAAVSRQCTELIRRDLLREMRGPHPPAGRPHMPVDIDTEQAVVCGAHIALRHTTLAILDLRGQVLARVRIPHRAACQARDVRVRDQLEQLTGLPVRVDGHARAMVRAEELFGDRRARSSAVHLFAGNVVDAAFAVGGTVHHGPRSAAGAIAHLAVPGRTDPCECGATGCLQAVASDGALAAQAAAAGIGPGGIAPAGIAPGGIGPGGIAPGGIAPAGDPAGSPVAALLAAAEAGDPRADELFRRRARAIGAAAATLRGMLNPGVLIVAEAGVMLLPGCLDVLRAEVRDRCPHWPWDGSPEPPVIASSFGRDVLAVAAGTVMLAEIYADPAAI